MERGRVRVSAAPPVLLERTPQRTSAEQRGEPPGGSLDEGHRTDTSSVIRATGARVRAAPPKSPRGEASASSSAARAAATTLSCSRELHEAHTQAHDGPMHREEAVENKGLVIARVLVLSLLVCICALVTETHQDTSVIKHFWKRLVTFYTV